MFRLSDIRSQTTPPTAVEGAPLGAALPVCTISVQHHDGWSAVMLRGELDRQSAEELRAAVADELAEIQPVVIELVGLEFTDVQGVRVLEELVRAGERCRGRAGVEIHGARGQVTRLIQLLGLEEILG